jgi:hypothetical protein
MKRVNAFLNRSTSHRPEPSPITTESSAFEHKPLDEAQSSLRLLTLSSELSTDGCIQSYVSHSTLERASYVCLSYCWGPPEYVRIHINGAPFWVRKNLFDFLDLVRNMPMTFYWIDAICIDMENSIERNHQIKQMGQIYSKAFLVYAWLGKLPSMAPFVQHLRNGSQSLNGNSAAPRNTMVQARDTVKNCVFNNEYWKRAWVSKPQYGNSKRYVCTDNNQVTPEIFLARTVLILVGKETFKFPDLVQAMSNFEHPDLMSGFRDCTFAQFANMINNPAKLRSRTLINLVDEFRDKECEIPRDRIYSLLPICSNFQHPEVDYQQSAEDLAFDTLRRSDEPLCTCSALLIAQTLCLIDPGHNPQDASDTIPYLEFDVRGLRFARHAMLCNDQIHSWGHYKLIGTDMFGHDQLHSECCPAFESLMDALQAYAMEYGVSTPTQEVPSPTQTDSPPFLLKMMDDEHIDAMLHGFGPALEITSDEMDSHNSTVRVALWLLAELIPQCMPLCSRFAHRKDKLRENEENSAVYDQDGLAYRSMSMSMERRGTEVHWDQNMDVRRIDSAGPGKSQEDEGPISRMRLVKCAIHTTT